MTADRKNPVSSFLERLKGEDMDLQAGSSGLSVPEAVDRYLRTPGHLLALLRLFVKKSIGEVKSASGIAEATLQSYEKGEKQPTLRDLTTLAKFYEVDLRVLLEVFGHVAWRRRRSPAAPTWCYGSRLPRRSWSRRSRSRSGCAPPRAEVMLRDLLARLRMCPHELEQLRDVAACARHLCEQLGRRTPLTPQQHAAYSLLEDSLRDLDGR